MLYFSFLGILLSPLQRTLSGNFPSEKVCRYVGSLYMSGKVLVSFHTLTVIFLTTPKATVYCQDPNHLELLKATLILLPL